VTGTEKFRDAWVELRDRLWRWRHRRCVPVMERRPEFRCPRLIATAPHNRCRARIEAENEVARQRADRRG
jgi:hypothetical protein